MAKIAIRVDGGARIGMGHVMRTLVLAKELAKTNDVLFVCRTDEPFGEKYRSGIEKIQSEGFKVITIKEDQVINELENIKADCLITDSYDVNEDYFNKTRKMFGITGYIDDMNLYCFDVDFIINSNINAGDLKYNVDKSTTLLLGHNYTLLRDEFRKIRPKRIIGEVNSVLITVGGSDPNNYTSKIIDIIKELDFQFHVVVGLSFIYIAELENYESRYNNIRLHFNPNIAVLMGKCDIAISACGSTLYELATMGLPTIGLILAENQNNVAIKMEEKRVIVNLGNIESLKSDVLINTVKWLSTDLEMRKELSQNQSLVVSKDGAHIAAKAIDNIIGKYL